MPIDRGTDKEDVGARTVKYCSVIKTNATCSNIDDPRGHPTVT